MRQITFLLVAVAMVTGVAALGTAHADDQAAPVFLTNIPPGYRDWRVISVQDGKPGDAALLKTCFPCHNQAKARDLVFTHYAP